MSATPTRRPAVLAGGVGVGVVCVHHEDLVAALPVTSEGHAFAVWRPIRAEAPVVVVGESAHQGEPPLAKSASLTQADP